MASGALLAAVWFAWQSPNLFAPLDWHEVRRLFPEKGAVEGGSVDPRILMCLALLLLLAVGWPLVPSVFNWLVHRLARRFRDVDAAPLPRFRLAALLPGGVLAIVSWFLMGASLWAVLQTVLPTTPAWTLERWGRYSAFVALAYVAGFIIIWMPSGVGVREVMLLLVLVPEIRGLLGPDENTAGSLAFLATVLLRLVWFVAEMVGVGVLYWLPSR
jgi:hypothetical protein